MSSACKAYYIPSNGLNEFIYFIDGFPNFSKIGVSLRIAVTPYSSYSWAASDIVEKSNRHLAYWKKIGCPVVNNVTYYVPN